MQSSSKYRGRRARCGIPLIVHSHLRWDFVWQRPQQLLTRLAAYAPVLFLEEPVFLDDAANEILDVKAVSAGVYRAVPRLRASLRDDYDAAIARVRTLMLTELAKHEGIGPLFADAVQWFYTPMPAPAMLGAFNEVGVVYDCMDELSQFRFAHPDIARRERLLMERADIVFAGGRKLCESKSRFHPNVHFFGCGVDCDHFARARDPRTPTAPAVDALRSPGSLVAGYYGVIDERLDYSLIAQLAESDPALHVVMVGPTTKVDPAALPRHPNLHWLGARSYDALPSYVRGFDVCLMPFALNESTEYINPTKTLEYMAAGRPVVSTAVADVVRNFTPIVRVARDATEFINGALADARGCDAERVLDGLQLARASSWESVVSAMNDLMIGAVEATAERAPVRAARTRSDAAERTDWNHAALAATPATA